MALSRFKVFAASSSEDLEKQLNDWADAHPEARIRRTQLACLPPPAAPVVGFAFASGLHSTLFALVNYEVKA